MADDPKPDEAPERELKDLRIPVMMTSTEVEAIDDWSFSKRIRSRSEAIRRLSRLGISADSTKQMKRGDDLIHIVEILRDCIVSIVEHDPIKLRNETDHLVDAYSKLLKIITEDYHNSARAKMMELMPADFTGRVDTMSPEQIIAYMRGQSIDGSK